MKKFNINGIVITMVMVVAVVGCYGGTNGANNCKRPGEYCNVVQGKICCGGLHCEGSAFGEDRKCVASYGCTPGGKQCNIMNECCYPYNCNAMGSGYCVRKWILNNIDTFSSNDRDDHFSSSTS
ncbi:hypothetical protein CsatB_015914 [Cannabis sativa]